MKSVHRKSFRDAWHALYHRSNPGLKSDHWHVGGVDWLRERHDCRAGAYSFRIETHVLSHAGPRGGSWRLLVVVERWWRDDRRDAIRTTEWRHVLDGRNRDVISWLSRQRAAIEADLPPFMSRA